jgi:iron complex outermembrane recepter protein
MRNRNEALILGFQNQTQKSNLIQESGIIRGALNLAKAGKCGMAVLVFIGFVILTTPIQAQTNSYKITGNLKDEAQKPVESATVILFRSKDSVSVQSSSSDKQGNFLFANIESGVYYLRVSSVGYMKQYTQSIEILNKSILLNTIILQTQPKSLNEVSVIGRRPLIEQKLDRTIVNVDASPSNVGTSVMDVLEKSPGITIDKDDNISLKGKQGVTVMIDNKPTYLNAIQLASYLKSLPSSAVDQIEIMTNPSAKYDAAGNSGIINIKTKKNKARGFNGNLSLTQTQGVYPKPSASLNLNYKTGKFNFFANAGYSHWQGFQNLDIMRNYLDPSDKQVTSIFSQHTNMQFTNPEMNLKLGMDYFLSQKTTIGFVLSGFQNAENTRSSSTIFLKDPNYITDSIVFSPSTNNNTWKNQSVNLNFRHQFDSTGREITVDLDYVTYRSTSSQYFDNITYNPDWTKRGETILTGNLPSNINISSFKTDYTHPFKHELKLEAGIKSSYVSTDNIAGYFNLMNGFPEVDTTKTNRFSYRENINAAYINLNKQLGKWNFQAGLRLENTNYSGHQFGNQYTIKNNDSTFQNSYVNLFPTVFVSYQLNDKNQFSANLGRRIDRPAYQDLNPFLFFLDEYTYQAGNPYLQPQYTQNIEFSHTYNGFLTTTLNYSLTRNFFSETFQQDGHATIVRNGNIGKRQNAGIAVSAQVPIMKWWTAILYGNLIYNQFSGVLYGEPINVSAPTFLGNLNNQFHFNKGWGAEISGFYRSSGVEGQILVNPMGQASAAVSKQLFKEKASLKLALRDIFYTGQVSGHINFQQTEASFQNSRDSRQLSLSFSYRFGKPFKVPTQKHAGGGAEDEQNRVKVGGNN